MQRPERSVGRSENPAGDYVRFHNSPFAWVDAMTASTARRFPRHTHDQYGIGVVDSGAHSSWSDRGQVEATPGKLICVNPGEVHDGSPLGERSRSWRLLYLDPRIVAETLEDVSDGASRSFLFVSPVFADNEVRRLFDVAFARIVRGPAVDGIGQEGAQMQLDTALLSLIACMRRHSTVRGSSSRRPVPAIARARARIDADPTAPLTLEALAREAGLSRYQLIRGFAHEIGLTPHAYVLQRRIALARQLILRRRDLAEVAVATGFYDQSHFTRYFVRQFGVTPHRYGSRTD